jgi:hypothetical protein
LQNDIALAAIPVVVITGARTALRGLEVLRKPFDLSELIATVARHCNHEDVGEHARATSSGPHDEDSPT